MATVGVYGTTWAAVNAACASAQRGADTTIYGNYGHFGGCIANGLSAIDLGRYGVHGIGYLTKEFFRRQTSKNGFRFRLIRTTPSTAEKVFMEMLKAYRVKVRAGITLTGVNKTGAAVTSIVTDGGTFSADRWIDGTEEQDLIAMGGATMRVGRESAAQYGETLGGFYPVPTSFVPMDCYASPGVLLPQFSPYPALSPGDADGGVQAYGFRLPLTSNVENKLPWKKPPGYDPTLFEYLRRQLPLGPSVPFGVANCLNGKGDMNADFGIPLQWQWPTSTPTQRAALLDTIFNTQAGWLYFLANDPSVNSDTQRYVRSWGLCRDEFPYAGNTMGGWPKEIYVRHARGFVGQYVMTQADGQTTITKTDNVAVGFYSFDFHVAQYLAVIQNGVPGYILDTLGLAADSSSRQVIPYHIPYRSGLPLASELSNVGSATGASASSVASASLRIDLHKANFGSAMGWAAAESAISGVAMSSLNVPAMQAALDALGQVRDYTPPS